MSTNRELSHSVTQRLVYALALIPIVPSVAMIGATLCEVYFSSPWLDDLRFFQFLFSALWVTATIAIWRSLVVWTLGRKWLTALVSLVPFVQVVYARPLWTSGGCFLDGLFHDEFMSTGQHQLSIGLWVWLSVWVWWGWEKLTMTRIESSGNERGSLMTPVAARLAVSIGSVPFLFALFLLVGEAFDNFLGWTDPGAAFACCAVLAVVVWILIWRNAVDWTPQVRRHTAWSAGALLGLPVVLQIVLWDRVPRGFAEGILGASSVLGWGLWMTVTVRIWPMKPEAVGHNEVTPRCLKCGYLLIGLRATRCPECGDEPTIDVLWAATSARW